MAAPRERLIEAINWSEVRGISEHAKLIQTRQAAAKLRRYGMEECPVDTGLMKSRHKLVYLGDSNHGVFVDTDYAMFVFDGTVKNSPNRWLWRALDRLKAELS